MLGGQVVSPGDVICADDDGVVVVARAEAAWALEQSRGRLAKEAASRSRLEAGELGVDMYGLRDVLIGLGVQYVDSLDDLEG
jgi:4-hydroxy-4-methyl-2-oxoglutarate aldolase